MKRLRLTGVILSAGFLCSCAVGPNYHRPLVQAPVTYKTEGPWRLAAPKDALPKSAWWEVFRDAELNDFEQQLLKSNQSLEAARDQLSQARALARVTSAGYFPTLSANPSASRSRYSGNRPLASTPNSPLTQSTYQIPFLVSYEPDLFGTVRRSLEASNASLQSTAASLYNARLVLTAELAADYFNLRELDAEMQVLEESVGIQKKGLQLVENRHQGGVASGLDLAEQQTLLDSTVTQLYLVQQQRAQFEHAIAVLTGNPASSFSVPVLALKGEPPAIPLGIPSDLLERRPDVASAERQMAYENAQVGVATAAFYPQLTISGSGGFQSTTLTNLITAPSAVWSLGAGVLQPIFQGGRNRANLEATRSAYEATVADYRQSVLTAFQQVEDGLSGLNALSLASTSQSTAVQDAQRALQLANNRYTGGLTTYLDVITAQSALLSNQRIEAQILGQQMVTSVYLVKALGGGWDASEIQNEQVHPRPGQVITQ